MLTTTYLLLGLIGASLLIAFGHKRVDGGKRAMGIGLIVAALIYLVFAVSGGADAKWMILELVGVAIYGSFAAMGTRASPWWLVAGWLLHPVWDVAIHYYGAGAAFTPAWYAIACVSFDVAVAAYIAYALSIRGESRMRVRANSR
jgi:hypothetical protein